MADNRFISVTQEQMDAGLASGNYVKDNNGVVRLWGDGTIIKVEGTFEPTTQADIDRIDADLAELDGSAEVDWNTNSNNNSNGDGSNSINDEERRRRREVYEARLEKFKIDAFDKSSKYWQGRFSKNKPRRQDGILRYPLESLTEYTDYLQIDISEYSSLGESFRSNPGSSKRYVVGKSVGNSARLTTRPIINAGTILLPIPSNIKDSNSVKYGDSSINGLAALGVESVTEIMTSDGGNPFTEEGRKAIMDSVGNVQNTVVGGLTKGVGNTEVARDVATKFFAAQTANVFGANVTTSQLLARSSGEIFNPNMELLFNGPTLRNFRFSFRLTPRNEEEAQQCKLIIRAFKRNMAPKVQGASGSGSWFLKTPNIFKLSYRSGRSDHPFLNKFKQCFLTDTSVSYTGDGIYQTYDDGTPTSMVLDLAFKEVEPIYDEDYDKFPGSSAVGY